MDNKLKEFLEFEKQNALFTRRYCGINYWQSMRLFVFRQLFTSYSSKVKGVKKDNIFGRFLSVMNKSVQDIVNWKKLHERDLLYFDQQNYRRVEGEEKDIYFDYWEFEKNYTINRCYYDADRERKSNMHFGIGTAVPALLHDILYFLSLKFEKLYYDKEEEEYLTRLYDLFTQKWNVTFSEADLKKRVKDAVITHRVYEIFFESLLKRAKPKAIFTAEYYVFKLFPLYNVAKKHKIPVIELSHGVVCNHDQYNYLETSHEGKELPDYFWAYGDLFTKYIQLPECMSVKVAGNPFLCNRKLKFHNAKVDEKTIVFYLDAETGEKMTFFVKQFLEKHDNKGYKIYCKMHPVDANYLVVERRILENTPHVEMVAENEEVYKLLSMAGHHVSGPSTVMYEATMFNVRRYLLKLNDYYNSLMEPLIENKLVEVFNSYSELEKLIFEENTKEHMEKEHEIWKDDAKAVGNSVLKEIISRG